MTPINEGNVIFGAAGCVHGKGEQRLLQDLEDGMRHSSWEVDEHPGSDLMLLRAKLKDSPTTEDIHVLIACSVEMERKLPVHAY